MISTKTSHQQHVWLRSYVLFLQCQSIKCHATVNKKYAVLNEWVFVDVRFLTKKTEKHLVDEVIRFDGNKPKKNFIKNYQRKHFFFFY